MPYVLVDCIGWSIGLELGFALYVLSKEPNNRLPKYCSFDSNAFAKDFCNLTKLCKCTLVH